MVPCFDPVPIEVAGGFSLLSIVKLADVFRATKSKSVGIGALIAPLPFGSLADSPKIDHFSHFVILEGNRVRFSSAFSNA